MLIPSYFSGSLLRGHPLFLLGGDGETGGSERGFGGNSGVGGLSNTIDAEEEGDSGESEYISRGIRAGDQSWVQVARFTVPNVRGHTYDEGKAKRGVGRTLRDTAKAGSGVCGTRRALGKVRSFIRDTRTSGPDRVSYEPLWIS